MFSLELFRGTVRLWRVPALAWPLGWGAYVFLVGWSVIIISQTLDMTQYLNSLPPGILQAFGIERFDVPGGDRALAAIYYLTVNVFSTALIVAAIFAMFIAPGLMAREVDRGTIDTLLARPLRRRAYVLTRFAFYLVMSVALAVLTAAAMALTIGPIGGFAVPWRGLAIAAALFGLAALAFGSIGFAVAAWRLSTGAGTAAVALVLALMFILNLAAPAVPWLDGPSRLSFYTYWKPVDLVIREHVAWDAPLVFAGVSIAATVLAIEIFARRDIA
ncbi:MAG: ABC transporter permease [Chloroflexota bacterium]|nr:ABC transporter permease [Chloroflexota bacterium]